jgi:hypothetical protein
MIVKQISTMRRTITGAIRSARCMLRLIRLLSAVLCRGFVSSVAGFIFFKSLMRGREVAEDA